MKVAINSAVVLAVFLLLVVCSSTTDENKRLAESERWVAHTQRVRVATSRLAFDLSALENFQRSFVLTGDRAAQSSFEALVPTLDSRLASIRQLTSDNSPQQQRLARIEPLLDGELADLARSVRLRVSMPADAAGQATIKRALLERGSRLRALLDEMTRAEDALFSVRTEAVRVHTKKVLGDLGGGVLIIFGLLIAVVLMLRGQVRRRAIAERLVASNAIILNAVLDSIADGVVVADPSGKFTHFNPAAERLNGRTAADVPPDKWSDHYKVFRPDSTTPFPPDELPLTRALKGETVASEELFVRHPDGTGNWLEISAAPVSASDGTNLGGVVVLRDATERRRIDQEIQRLNAQLASQVIALESTNRELETFSYSVSHDLRSPLRSIDGFSQALLEDYADRLDGDAADYLNRIRAATQRMGLLIDDMLSLSRVTRREMVRERVDLTAYAHGCIEELRRSDPDREVEVTIQPAMSAPGDPHLLRAVFDNLIGNAWKFTGKTPHARIELGIEQSPSGETACFVRDNGAGFDPEYTHKLFGVFQRLHSMDEFAGSGIGLATVQRVILRHGGRVWAEGESGAGATFRFTLPGLAAEQAATAPEEKAA